MSNDDILRKGHTQGGEIVEKAVYPAVLTCIDALCDSALGRCVQQGNLYTNRDGKNGFPRARPRGVPRARLPGGEEMRRWVRLT